MNVEVAYLWNGRLKFWIDCAPSWENLLRKNLFLYGSVEQQMRENDIFFTPVKYTLVCHAPWVFWAARHTTVSLNVGIMNIRGFWPKNIIPKPS